MAIILPYMMNIWEYAYGLTYMTIQAQSRGYHVHDNNEHLKIYRYCM